MKEIYGIIIIVSVLTLAGIGFYYVYRLYKLFFKLRKLTDRGSKNDYE